VGKDEYVKAFETATRDLEALMQQRAEIDQQILHLRQTLVSLSRLCGFTPTVSWGMTEGVRSVLRRAEQPMTAVDVRDELANWGFDMTRYANDLSAIHTVLKRLNKAGEIRFVPRAAGSHAYEWQRPVTTISLTAEKSPLPKGRK
jgi:cob(I)alamin adenosyltransferase